MSELGSKIARLVGRFRYETDPDERERMRKELARLTQTKRRLRKTNGTRREIEAEEDSWRDIGCTFPEDSPNA